jgi:hypothetical protein
MIYFTQIMRSMAIGLILSFLNGIALAQVQSQTEQTFETKVVPLAETSNENLFVPPSQSELGQDNNNLILEETSKPQSAETETPRSSIQEQVAVDPSQTVSQTTGAVGLDEVKYADASGLTIRFDAAKLDRLMLMLNSADDLLTYLRLPFPDSITDEQKRKFISICHGTIKNDPSQRQDFNICSDAKIHGIKLPSFRHYLVLNDVNYKGGFIEHAKNFGSDPIDQALKEKKVSDDFEVRKGLPLTVTCFQFDKTKKLRKSVKFFNRKSYNRSVDFYECKGSNLLNYATLAISKKLIATIDRNYPKDKAILFMGDLRYLRPDIEGGYYGPDENRGIGGEVFNDRKVIEITAMAPLDRTIPWDKVVRDNLIRANDAVCYTKTGVAATILVTTGNPAPLSSLWTCL